MDRRFEVFMAVTMKNAVFWDVMLHHIPEDSILLNGQDSPL
jgi:hypothetical protein